MTVRRIREGEAKSVWKVEHEKILHPFPMEFLTARSLIAEIKLLDHR